jgi:hypothetical protein
MIKLYATEHEAKRAPLQIVKWWKVTATLLSEDEPLWGETFYMRSVYMSTAIAEVKTAVLEGVDCSGPDVRIDSAEEVPQPPDGALYQMVETSKPLRRHHEYVLGR